MRRAGRRRDSERCHRFLLAERAELVATLRGLDGDQWTATTLCAGWTVRDVAAHLLGWDTLLVHRSTLGAARAAARYAGARLRLGSIDDVNRTFIERLDGLDPAELVARLDALPSGSPRWLFERVAPGAQLAEYAIHHEDIRRPLGLDRTVVPPDRLRAALDGITRLPGVGAKRRLQRNRWTATDTDWSAGAGADIRRPALDLLLTLAGRPVPERRRT